VGESIVQYDEGMPRFTVKDLLIATTLVAIGLTMIGYALAFPSLLREELDPRVIVGIALIGVGLGTPLRHRLLGATLMLVLMVVLGLVRYVFHG
jgi:hypothetical protein